MERQLNIFKTKNEDFLKEFTDKEQNEILDGVKIAFENFGQIIDISLYNFIPYTPEFIGDKYNSNVSGNHNGTRREIAIKPGSQNIRETVIHEIAHNIEEGINIPENLKKKLIEIGVKNNGEIYDLELNLPNDELVRQYANRLYGNIDSNGKIQILGTEFITTFLQLLGSDEIDINSLLNEKGELKQQILIVLEVLLNDN